MQEYLNSLGDELVWPSQSGDCFDNSFFLQGACKTLVMKYTYMVLVYILRKSFANPSCWN